LILLDTDICIHILRGNTNPLKNRSLIEHFLLTIAVIHSDNQIMKRFGMLKAELERLSKPLADADLLIAATALERCNLLITGNEKHFKRIGDLALANWVS